MTLINHDMAASVVGMAKIGTCRRLPKLTRSSYGCVMMKDKTGRNVVPRVANTCRSRRSISIAIRPSQTGTAGRAVRAVPISGGRPESKVESSAATKPSGNSARLC